MVNFDFYKVSGQWRLRISENDTILSTICFEDVSYEEIVSIVPTLIKADISSVNIDFTNKQ